MCFFIAIHLYRTDHEFSARPVLNHVLKRASRTLSSISGGAFARTSKTETLNLSTQYITQVLSLLHKVGLKTNSSVEELLNRLSRRYKISISNSLTTHASYHRDNLTYSWLQYFIAYWTDHERKSDNDSGKLLRLASRAKTAWQMNMLRLLLLLACFPSKGKWSFESTILSVCPSVCVPPNNFWTSWQIFMKFGREVIPLKVTSTPNWNFEKQIDIQRMNNF
jgi:hypothetical protein